MDITIRNGRKITCAICLGYFHSILAKFWFRLVRVRSNERRKG